MHVKDKKDNGVAQNVPLKTLQTHGSHNLKKILARKEPKKAVKISNDKILS